MTIPPSPPPAQGIRLNWEALPENVRYAVAHWAGSRVVHATTQPGGFSPGATARLLFADGRRLFVKAVCPNPNPESPEFHRREARVVAALPATAPVPRLLFSYDEGPQGWVVLAFEDIDGRHPAQPWQPDELERVLQAMDDLSDALTPSPLRPPLVRTALEVFTYKQGGINGWQHLRDHRDSFFDLLDPWSREHLDALATLEEAAPQAAQGSTLLHFDTRADNILLTPATVYFVDWPHATIGAPWVEILGMAPSITMQGGPDPETLLKRSRAARFADRQAINAVIAALAGFFTQRSLLPPAPGLPTLRAFQAAQGAIARAWLEKRSVFD